MNILYDERVDGALPAVDKANVLAQLRQALPDLEILHRAEDLRPYECDGLSAYRVVPLLVVLPERIEQVQTLLRLCHANQVPVVARGAGTGAHCGDDEVAHELGCTHQACRGGPGHVVGAIGCT